METYLKALRVFFSMVERCHDEANKSYKNYGGRGIYVDPFWINNVNHFVEWYEDNFFPGCQIDRIDNDGPYSKENCRLVTALENSKNRRNTRWLIAWGENKTYSEWQLDDRKGQGVNIDVIAQRVDRGRLSPEEIISTPVSNIRGQQHWTPKYELGDESKTLLEWANDSRCVVQYKTLFDRKKRGWDLLTAMTKPARKINKKN